MENTFQSLDTDKKKRIINSALEEFCLHNYDKASTNSIVKRAGISKGSLFQYFANKQALYEYLEKFSVNIMLEAIERDMNFDEPDLFSRIKLITVIKLEVAKGYPYLMPFAKIMYERKNMEQIKEEVLTQSPNIYERIYYENINYGLFRDDMDQQKAIEITQWVIERIAEDYMKSIVKNNETMEIEVLMDKVDEFLAILKQAFYK